MNRHLIVNADDFGLSAGVNRGIVECVQRGIVTSASLMVRWPAASEAADYAKKIGTMSVGLHVDLGEWTHCDGQWKLLYVVVDLANAQAVEFEIQHQLTEFRRLLGRNPSHLDSHQHVHRNEPVRSIMMNLARELGVPLREFDPRVRYCGDFYGQGAGGEPLPELLTVANLRKILTALPGGVVELGCHPGYGDGLKTPYRQERALELGVLCNPESRRVVTELGYRLCRFDELGRIEPFAQAS